MDHWEIPTAEGPAILWSEPGKHAAYKPSPLQESLNVPSATSFPSTVQQGTAVSAESARGSGLASVARWICSSGWQSRIEIALRGTVKANTGDNLWAKGNAETG